MERFKGQKYEKLRKHHQEMGVPWTDPTFPPSDTSIGHSKSGKMPRIVTWKRPHDLCDNPRLYVDGISHHDATQGHLGNCWFVAACSVLSGGPEMWSRVVPEALQQEFHPDTYAGIFRFRFWRFGTWIEICVDDLLPCTDQGQLLFTHSTNHTEFWSALLEKAYAKLHGCYAVLDSGNLSDALVDFTSGVSEVIDLKSISSQLRADIDAKKGFFTQIQRELDDHSLMCCAIQASPEDLEERTDLGLVKGHAYGITSAKKIDVNGTKWTSIFKEKKHLYLLRLQNPWGKKELTETSAQMSGKGASNNDAFAGPSAPSAPSPPCYYANGFANRDLQLYSSSSLSRMLTRSTEWSRISNKEKEKLGLSLQDDGEFWMPLDDFLVQFSEMSICRLINTSLFTFAKTWKESQAFGTWRKGEGANMNRAGGCLNFPDTFLQNPQFRFDINADSSEIILQLSQRDARALLMEQKEYLVIGFTILKVELNRKYRLHRFSEAQIQGKSDYIKSKHIFLRTNLNAGRYVIVVTTFSPNESTDFLLRLFSERNSKLTSLTKNLPVLKWYQRQTPKLLTRLTILNASDLPKQDVFRRGNPYCVVKSENHKISSPPVTDSELNPDWNEAMLFYRKRPQLPLKISVWNKSFALDTLVGQCEISTLDPFDELTLELIRKKSSENSEKAGTIRILIENFENLEEI